MFKFVTRNEMAKCVTTAFPIDLASNLVFMRFVTVEGEVFEAIFLAFKLTCALGG